MKSSVAKKTETAVEYPAAEEVLTGLQAEPKQISPKYFYDQKGAQLFDAITELDEYYVTRTERQIVEDNRAAICRTIGEGANIVEPGAGSCEKIRWLLPDLDPARYTPMDISTEHLQASAMRLREEYPDLFVKEQAFDHTQGLKVQEAEASEPVVFFYPGSSIGNFEPAEAVEFMREMCDQITATNADDGGLLIGVDAKKDRDVLEAAYDDSEGVTREFNLNVLDHLNELLEGDLEVDNFDHLARYDEEHGRIEMHLQCKRSHSAVLAGEELEFAKGEMIHTENSYKYHPDEFARLAGQAGFQVRKVWQDKRNWFSLMYLQPE